MNSPEWLDGYAALSLAVGAELPSEVRAVVPASYFDASKAVRARALAEGLSALLLDLAQTELSSHE
jgi:hypothetical protein